VSCPVGDLAVSGETSWFLARRDDDRVSKEIRRGGATKPGAARVVENVKESAGHDT